MYCRGHRNPLINRPRFQTPEKFLAPLVKSPALMRKEVSAYKTVFLNGFLHREGLEPWLHSFGIGATGYTFIEQGVYQRAIEQQFKKDPRMLKRMSMSCDGFLLVSRKAYSSLFGILSLNLWTNVGESFFKEVGGSNKLGDEKQKQVTQKIIAVLRELKKELHSLAAESGITIGDKLPAIFKPRTTGKGSMPHKPRGGRGLGRKKLKKVRKSPKGTISGHYKAGSYDVYPLWLGVEDES